MNSETCRTKLKPQALMEETFYKTKRFFQKTFRNIKSFLLRGYQKLPRNPFANTIFSGSNKIGPKSQELDKEEGLLASKEQTKGDEECSKSSISISDHSRLDDLKEEKTRKYSGRKLEEPSLLATENFAKKMEDLEMMEERDGGDHALDIEEVVHYYSLLTSPAYLEIVDEFFMDVYLELSLPRPSRSVNSSMRKLGSTRIHSSMRKLDSASVPGSMRKLGSPSAHNSIRKLDTASVHSSIRKLDTASVHSSTRKLDSASVHSSTRKLDSASLHSSMRSLGPLKL